MSKTELRIDRLEIRLKGIASDTARASVDGLGDELIGELGRRQQQLHRQTSSGRAMSISRVDSSVVQPDGEQRPAELRRFIARRVAAAIEAKLKR